MTAVATADALRFQATERTGEVGALLRIPPQARCLLVLGHGAGAGMTHPFMEDMAERLARRSIATLRYQFPYMEQGKRPPNPAPVLKATVRSAVAAAAKFGGGLPLLAGGKSMGGRMTSLLFLLGTRDRLADLELLRSVCHGLGPRCTLEVLDQADHTFRVPKRSGIDQEGVLDRLADTVFAWQETL